MTDLRIHPTIERLSQLGEMGRTFSWHPPYQRLSPLTGQHHSTQRGRGLDFQELRHYYPGDDVRCIDWKVTQRTGKPHLRVYSEEKDKNVLLLIDLRSSMFFASDGCMKSVIASELAAIISGAICKDGDRIGALVMTDTGVISHPFKRGAKSYFGLLNSIVSQANALPVWQEGVEPPHLNDALQLMQSLKMKDSQCFLISDFHDYEPHTSRCFLDAVSAHNSLVALRIFDPLEQQFPSDNLVLGDNQFQLELRHDDRQLRGAYETYVREQLELLRIQFAENKVAMLEISTHQDSWSQLQALTNR